MKSWRIVPAARIPTLLICFFFSGMAGLIYQVAWVKALGLIFGHSVYAVATVLGVFMAGLAAGGACFGRWCGRSPDPVGLYAWCELSAGLTGALSLAGLQGVHSLYIAWYPALEGSSTLLLGTRILGALFVLFIPTFVMGGTYPILVSATARTEQEVTKRVSQLYWSNTAGAVSGTLLAGFMLLPFLGLRLTITCAVALNMIAGFAAHSVRTGTINRSNKTPSSPVSQRAVVSARWRPAYSLILFFAGVGCTALAYEISWTRLLEISIGNSTYAFTLMLALFLAGIAIGGALFQFLMSRGLPVSRSALGWLQIGITVASLCSLVAFHWTPALIPALLRANNRTFFGLVLAQLATTALALLPAAILFGFNFPMVIHLIRAEVGGTAPVSLAVGSAYAANTIGCIAGSILTGFILIPWLGSFRVIVAVAESNLLLALWMHMSLSRRRLAFVAADGLLLIAVLLVGSSPVFYDQALLSLSAVLYGSSYQGRLTLNEISATKDLIFTAEGLNDSISVVRTDGDVALRVNGKVDASTEDTTTQLLLGHLGAAFHPSPRRVLVIGFGSGMTASAVARYSDVEKIDCVEIEPAVLRAAPYLESLNRNVLNDSRLHIIFEDARNYLLFSREKYDLIISEPSNPWISGIATLFTDEYYAAARKRLRPNGIFVQWAQAYSLHPKDLRIISATFVRHFPEVTLWRGGETDLLFMGRTGNSALKLDRLRSLWKHAGLRHDFEVLDIHEPEGLIAYFLLGDAEVRKLANGSILNTDDRTVLEYDSPRTLLASDLMDADHKLIGQFRTSRLPKSLEASESRRALTAAVKTALDLNDSEGASSFLQAVAFEPPSSAVFTARGRLALLQGSLSEAKAFFEKATSLDPDSAETAYWLASAEHLSGDDGAALSRVERILGSHPDYQAALEDEMKWSAERGDFQTALSAQLKRMALLSDPPAFEYGRLGALWMNVSDLSEAESVLRKGLAKDSYCYACHLGLGQLYIRTGKFSLARQNFEWVIRFFPDSDPAAFRSLVAVDLLLKDTRSAKSVLEEGLRVFPDDAALVKAQGSLGR